MPKPMTEPFGHRTKADFKALREMVGLTQKDVAHVLGVNPTTARRWEREGFPGAPEDAWDLLETCLSDQLAAVESAMVAAGESGADSLRLPYYRDWRQFEAQGGSSALTFGAANAASRAAADALSDEGVEVVFSYPGRSAPRRASQVGTGHEERGPRRSVPRSS